jgi:hypothetical protein
MWLLIWLKLTAAQGVEHFHLGTFYKELDCTAAKAEAKVLITDNNQAMDCIFVSTFQGVSR